MINILFFRWFKLDNLWVPSLFPPSDGNHHSHLAQYVGGQEAQPAGSLWLHLISLFYQLRCPALTSRSFLGPMWCGVLALHPLPLLRVSLRLSAGPGVRKKSQTRWGKGREIDYQLESAGYLYIHLSITTSDTTTFREQWPLLYFHLPNFTHVPLMANSKWNHTGKAMLGNSSHFNQLDRTQAICVVRKLLLGSEPWAET